MRSPRGGSRESADPRGDLERHTGNVWHRVTDTCARLLAVRGCPSESKRCSGAFSASELADSRARQARGLERQSAPGPAAPHIRPTRSYTKCVARSHEPSCGPGHITTYYDISDMSCHTTYLTCPTCPSGAEVSWVCQGMSYCLPTCPTYPTSLRCPTCPTSHTYNTLTDTPPPILLFQDQGVQGDQQSVDSCRYSC